MNIDVPGSVGAPLLDLQLTHTILQSFDVLFCQKVSCY